MPARDLLFDQNGHMIAHFKVFFSYIFRFYLQIHDWPLGSIRNVKLKSLNVPKTAQMSKSGTQLFHYCTKSNCMNPDVTHYFLRGLVGKYVYVYGYIFLHTFRDIRP